MPLRVLCTKQSGRLNIIYGMPRKSKIFKREQIGVCSRPALAVTN